MGFFDAFLRGVAGPGFSNLSAQNIREAEAEQRRAEAIASREDEQKFRAEQAAIERAEKNRQAVNSGGGLLSGAANPVGTGGASVRSGGGDPTAEELVTIAGAKKGWAAPRSLQALEAFRTGKNTHNKPGPWAEPEPDEEAFAEDMKFVGTTLETGYGKDPHQRATARETQAKIDAAAKAGGTGPDAERAARTSTYLGGDQEYGESGTSRVTGVFKPGSAAAAEAAKDAAQAGEHKASAAKHANETASNPKELAPLMKEQEIAGRRLAEAQKKELTTAEAASMKPADIAKWKADQVSAAQARLDKADAEYDAAKLRLDSEREAKEAKKNPPPKAEPAPKPRASAIAKLTPAVQSAAREVKAALRANKITEAEAVKRLEALGVK